MEKIADTGMDHSGMAVCVQRYVVFIILASGRTAGVGIVQLVFGGPRSRERAGTVFGLLPQRVSSQPDSHAGVDPMGAESGSGGGIWCDHGRLYRKAGQSADHFVGHLRRSRLCDVFIADGKQLRRCGFDCIRTVHGICFGDPMESAGGGTGV